MMKEDDIPDLPAPAKDMDGGDPWKKSRHCPQCGKEARIVSNYQGVVGYCGPCKIDWMIAPPMSSMAPPFCAPRGLSKTTLITPDFEQAYGENETESVYENRRKR